MTYITLQKACTANLAGHKPVRQGKMDLKERFAGGSTLVMRTPDFIRVLNKRATIYSITWERGSHKNTRTGRPKTRELQRVKSHLQVVYALFSPPKCVQNCLTTHLWLQNVPLYSYFLSSIVTRVFPAVPRNMPPDTEMVFHAVPTDGFNLFCTDS